MKQSSESRTKHICIVDDEETIVFTLTRLLRSFGYSVAGFCSPRDAAIGMEHCAPALLISDINMPEKSGLELAIEVTERFPDCKVLLFSGRSDVYELVTDMARHGYSFSVAMKPLHPEELVRRVGLLLEDEPVMAPHDRHMTAKVRFSA